MSNIPLRDYLTLERRIIREFHSFDLYDQMSLSLWKFTFPKYSNGDMKIKFYSIQIFFVCKSRYKNLKN